MGVRHSDEIAFSAVRESELTAILEMNQAARPALGSTDAAELDWFFQNAPYFFVARAPGNDGPLGFLIGLLPGSEYPSPNYRYFAERYSSFFYIDRVAIAEGCRRQGIGRHFYEHVEAWSRERELPMLCCEVNTRPRNDESLLFHERVGFRQVGSQDTEGGKKTVALLVKDLTI